MNHVKPAAPHPDYQGATVSVATILDGKLSLTLDDCTAEAQALAG